MDFCLSTLSPLHVGGCSSSSSPATPQNVLSDLVLGRSRRKLLVGGFSSRSRSTKEQQHQGSSSIFSPRDSFNKTKTSNNDNDDDDDDETASTVTASSVDLLEEDLSLSFSFTKNNNKSVSFCEPLVTATMVRPICTEDDKYYLHYSEHDYLDFKLDYLTNGKSPLVRATPRRVSFERDVVTSVHHVLSTQERQELSLYYNEDELQTFLDDFVESLQQQQQFLR